MVGRTAEAVPAPSAQPPVEPRTSRLTVRNRATATADAAGRAMQAHDAAAAVALFSGGVVHDDHRRMRGNPIVGIDGLSVAVHQRIAQYPYVEWRHLAVRGETLELARFQWRDDAGNTSTSLDLFEVGDDDLIACHARFDEDDFESAYRELEKRYYAGEGARVRGERPRDLRLGGRMCSSRRRGGSAGVVARLPLAGVTLVAQTRRAYGR